MDIVPTNAFEGDLPPFELLAQQNGFCFWLASDLAKTLGYESTSEIQKALNKALGVCMTPNINVAENFVSVTSGKNPEYKLSRFACYLTVMNADVRNPLVWLQMHRGSLQHLQIHSGGRCNSKKKLNR